MNTQIYNKASEANIGSNIKMRSASGHANSAMSEPYKHGIAAMALRWPTVWSLDSI
ncbi:hypothetical protein PILCRDRAFT_828309 [Piloderma croceum F 1598]|uniref:Uncharacterized protein n=1 Tax=Piloderma croceum (strain F 1598) TaxID=765440 RepID=A0A0C3F2Z6_PILCF|nr:hypothetical protein PILCRDRAFT_828309 [Piloderma croceum F 1598]